MKTMFFAFLVALGLASAVSGQTTSQPENGPACSLSATQAPAIRGLRLGMKPDEWLKLFPSLAQDEGLRAILNRPPQYPEYGLARISIESPTSRTSSGGAFRLLPKETFAGIDSVGLTLFDNQIVEYSIAYTPEYGANFRQMWVWNEIMQLVKVFAETFNLPVGNAWEADNQHARLRCAGFDFELRNFNGSPYAQLGLKPGYGQTMKERSEADLQKRRAAFKP